jgi:hypothetical protein
MERAFRRLEQQVPLPSEQPWKDGFVFRYQEQSIEQAIIQREFEEASGTEYFNGSFRDVRKRA